MAGDGAAQAQPIELARRDWLILLGMLAGLALFYRGSYQLPITLLGLVLFLPLAILRPHLAFLFVPLTVPLYFIPKAIWDARFGIRPEGIFFPLHEVVLLITVWVVGLRGLIWFSRIWIGRNRAASGGGWLATFRAVDIAPLLLFALAGTPGVAVALPDGQGAALRAWRWLIVEPLLFYGLMLFFLWYAPSALRLSLRILLAAFVLGGALAGLIGLLQWGGINLVPLFGGKVGFSEDRLIVGGVQRVSSVYGHPNNLGLYMGRIWPVAAALALDAPARGKRFFFWGCCVLAAGGLLVSFSKGALLGAAVAMGVLALAWWQRGRGRAGCPPHLAVARPMRSRWLVLAGAAGVVGVVGGVAIAASLDMPIERLNLLGESSIVRLKTWRSALAMVRDHPLLGIGLDQFLLHYPDYIAASLQQTNEQYTSHPHNLLLDVWLSMGIPGVLAFGWLLVRFFRNVWRRWREDRNWLAAGLAAAMGAGLVHGLVDNFYFVPDLALAFWVLVGGVCVSNCDCDK
jgi:O-antigen ligase